MISTMQTEVGYIAGNLSAVNMTGIDGRAAIATELGLVRRTVADAIDRSNQLNATVVALSTLVADQRAATASEIDALLVTVNSLTSALNAVANCDANGGNCVAAVPTCAIGDLGVPSNGHGRVLGSHGADVPVGVLVELGCRDGFYPATTINLSTCRATGWSHQAPQCQPCMQDCARCVAANTCDACAANRVIDVGGDYSRQNLNPSLIRFDHRDMGERFEESQGAGSTRNNRIQAARRMLVDGNFGDRSSWQVMPHYGRYCMDPAWVQVDLGSTLRVGAVTVWHYYFDARQYCAQKIAVSTTGAFTGEETWILDEGEEFGPTEQSEGRTISAHGIAGRYVRHYSAGSTVNWGTHFMEVAVTAAALDSDGATRCIPQ